MGTPSHRSWANWIGRIGLRRSPAPGTPDFADYGTAFGLDMSMSACATLPETLVAVEPPAAASHSNSTTTGSANPPLVPTTRPALG